MRFILSITAMILAMLGMSGIGLATPLRSLAEAAQQPVRVQFPVPVGWHRSGQSNAESILDGAHAIFGEGARICDMGGRSNINENWQISARNQCWKDFVARGQWTADGRENDFVCKQDPSMRFSMHNWGWKDPKACIDICTPCIEVAMNYSKGWGHAQFLRNLAHCDLTFEVNLLAT